MGMILGLEELILLSIQFIPKLIIKWILISGLANQNVYFLVQLVYPIIGHSILDVLHDDAVWLFWLILPFYKESNFVYEHIEWPGFHDGEYWED